jgi:hypothetical protein
MEPAFPASCTQVPAQMSFLGVGPSAETPQDTARIQAALSNCPAGQVVELTGMASTSAFVTAPLNIPSGVGLLLDGGVTLFASRNREDYQSAPISSTVDECGTQGTHGNGCKPLFSFASGGTNVGSGLYGYGVIDGRGYATTFKAGVDTGVTWWENSDVIPTGYTQNNPHLIKMAKSANFTLYKITLRNSPEFHVAWNGQGFTAWGVKISAPFPTHNTDGIDPSGTNITVTKSYISDGDDNVAVGASNSPSANITISNVYTYSGHGISIGSYTQSGITNMLVENSEMAGTGIDGDATGIHIKSAADRGGLIQTITYENMCLKDMRHILAFDPFYNTNTGTLIPTFSNIVLSNLHFLAPSTGSLAYLVEMQGYDASHISTITLQNVVFDSLLAANVKPASQYDNFTLLGNVYPSFLHSLPGVGISYSDAATALPGVGVPDCTNAFPTLAGELYLSTSSATNLQTASVPSGSMVTLNAVLEPTMSQQSYSGVVGTYQGASAPSSPLAFYEGAVNVGTASLSANGTFASLSLSNVTPGSHVYTAMFPGDANYQPLPFGSVIVTAASPAATATTLATGSLTTYTGANLSFTAAVQPVPDSGTLTFYNGSTIIATAQVDPLTGTASGTATVSSQAALALSASYGGSAAFLSSTSATQTLMVVQLVTLSASPSSIALPAGATGTLTITVTPQAGFLGNVSLRCTSPSTNISCSISNPSLSLTTSAPTSSVVTISIAQNAGKLSQISGSILLALVLPFMMTRKRREALAWLGFPVVISAILLGITACGSSKAPVSTTYPTFVLTISADTIASSTVSTVSVSAP